jgi:hypothetical protein
MRWWEGLPAVDAAGPEGAPDHRLRWDAGELVLTAHPDPEADEAMGALGGERCPCLDVLHAWRASHHGGAILTVGSRHPGDTTTAPTSSIAELRADLQRWRATSGSLVEEARLSRDTHAIDRLIAVAGPAERVAARRLGFLLLLALDRTLLHRLQASVAASLSVGEGPWPQLTAATAARVLPEATRLGWSGGTTSRSSWKPPCSKPSKPSVLRCSPTAATCASSSTTRRPVASTSSCSVRVAAVRCRR